MPPQSDICDERIMLSNYWCEISCLCVFRILCTCALSSTIMMWKVWTRVSERMYVDSSLADWVDCVYWWNAFHRVVVLRLIWRRVTKEIGILSEGLWSEKSMIVTLKKSHWLSSQCWELRMRLHVRMSSDCICEQSLIGKIPGLVITSLLDYTELGSGPEDLYCV